MLMKIARGLVLFIGAIIIPFLIVCHMQGLGWDGMVNEIPIFLHSLGIALVIAIFVLVGVFLIMGD